MGNLVRDVELRVTPKGTAIGQFGLAINREWKDESGTKREEVTFVDCEVWGKTAEIIAKYVTKGRPLFVSGRLKLDSWDDKTTGQKRSKMKIVVEQFQFIGGREGAQNEQPPANESTTGSAGGKPTHSPAGPADDGEEIPFAPVL